MSGITARATAETAHIQKIDGQRDTSEFSDGLSDIDGNFYSF
ncbi:MAG: hypothetical protein Q4G28_02785 [Neisseria sp.]|nr:hypothetical protein [Neisseria sp.]